MTIKTIWQLAPGDGNLPPIKPDLNSTGMAAFTSLTNTIAGWALLTALFAAIVGLIIMALGPAMGIQSGRRYGTLILLGSIAVAVGLGVIAGIINLVYKMFGGG